MTTGGSEMILQNISRYITLEKSEEHLLTSMLVTRSLNKKEFLVRVPEVSHHSAFVISGCLRSYSVDANGIEHIFQFAPPGWWIADIQSLVKGAPGKMNIDAVNESEILLLSRRDQESLFDKCPKFERFFRIIMENSLAANSNRLLDYMGMSAQERYFAFFERYPGLVNQIPQKHIAAYIGVTPEFLSKLRADLLKKK
jgi:CRP-like cAMP-binding protein